jgi:hypothetical protein
MNMSEAQRPFRGLRGGQGRGDDDIERDGMALVVFAAFGFLGALALGLVYLVTR